MDNRKPIKNDDPLAEPMRREAQLMRPEFSDDLHARLRAAVRAAVPQGPQAVPGSRRTLLGDLGSWAIAAAASIAVFIGSALFWNVSGESLNHPIGQSTSVEPAKPPADEIDSTAALVEDTATGLGQWVESTVDDNQWAGLDRDAQTAVATVTASLPFDLSAAIATTDPTE
jgi:hypothetical protein